MSAVMKSPIHSAYVNYIAHGMALVPIQSGKGPTTTGWNERHNCWTTSEQVDDTVGVGLAHAYSNTCAIDIDDMQLATEWLAERGIVLDELLNAAEAVQINSGNPGHAKLIYRIASPLSSKKITVNGKTALEFRCATANGKTVQDVLPSLAVHPSTGQYYKWAGRGHWSTIPDLPFIVSMVWQSLLTEDEPAPAPAAPVDLDEARSAMMAIDPSCDRDTWIEVGMAWHSAGGAFDDWDTWSQGSIDKYPGNREMVKQWQSCKPDRAISLGTLYHHAIEAGWKKPAPDVSALFNTVEVQPIKQVFDFLRPAIPDINLDVFPSLLKTRVTELSSQRGCDPVVPLFAALAAVSGAVDKRTRLELMHDYQVPPILWLMTVGSPGDKKTPGSKPLFKPLYAMEVEDRPSYRDAHLLWEAQEAMYSAAKRAYLEHHQSADALLDNSVSPGVPVLPPEPQPLRLVVNDVTSQKLVRLCAARPRGILCYLDEMGDWIKKMNDARSTDDRGAWIASYESSSYVMDRVMDGTIMADNLAVAIYGNVQPKVLREQIDRMGSDGLLQRFIPGILNYELTGKPIPVASSLFTSEAAWDELLRKLYALPEMVYYLSNEAYQEFDAFQTWFDQMRRNNIVMKVNDIYLTAFSKLESTCGRVALLMHLIVAPYETHLSGETMRNAIEFIKYYVIPSLRYTYLEISGLLENSLEKWVIDYISQMSGEVDTISLSELKRAARRQLDHLPASQVDNVLRDIMSYLESSGWVALATENRKQTVWAINSELAARDPEDRKKIIKAKQSEYDHRREVVLRSGKDTPRYIVKGYRLEWDSEA